ncbi:LysE family transporter [Roseomonas eburnea]|uniref:LysE family transporter n=1 Tax=Neoroseomonas eburnea TaxID=1346889 RepID=A0A9X9X8F9_9PROT|nr:LysE family transporter [Neoroseomonas eburnea]MBR0679995.1 LysE family transporter [Neoroseomonas eburnea]
MEFLPSLLTLAGMHLLVAMLPGPNTVVVSWLSATVSRGDGLRATAGVVIASLVWVVLSLFGVGTLLLEAGALYAALRLLGAAYLAYVGIRMLRAGWRPAAPGDESARPALAGRSPFAAGLLTTLSNPKSAVFWTSAFLVAVPPHAPAWLYAAIVAVIAVQSALWYGAVALLLSTGVAKRSYLRLARWLDMVAGGVMVALGLKLADEVRREIAVRAAS